MVVFVKTLFLLALFIACFTPASLPAANDTVRVAIITQTTEADLRNELGRSAGRDYVFAGQVFEVAGSQPGFQIKLKLDTNRVAIVHSRFVRIHETTPAELDQAKAKFNGVGAEFKSIIAASQQKLASAQSLACSTCPKQRARAGAAWQNAIASRNNELAALQQKNQALLAESLAWAAAK